MCLHRAPGGGDTRLEDLALQPSAASIFVRCSYRLQLLARVVTAASVPLRRPAQAMEQAIETR